MGVFAFFFIITICLLILLSFFTEKAPDWVELDEYYRSRWYK